MRWLTGSLLVGLAVGLASHVGASCLAGDTAFSGTPDANALTLFVTSADVGVMNGNLMHFPTVGVTTGDTSGLQAADHICTYYATNPGATNIAFSANNNKIPYFNQDTNGNTVQFRALLSTDSVDAIDRFASVSNVNIVNSANVTFLSRKCLAANIADLFNGPSGLGYTYTTNEFLDEAGASFASGTQVWTGTGDFPNAVTADKPGGKYHANGQPVSTTTGFCYNTGASQAWDNSATGNGAIGVLKGPSASPIANQWIYDFSTGVLACSQGVRLICLSAQPFSPNIPNVGGDPQFVGLQGQHFQVHGMPDEYFNLITTPSFQLNSRFTYLASGTCNYNNTECWTHPGTYVDQLGFMFPGIQIKTVAGPHHKGLRAWVNGEEMTSHSRLRLTSSTGNNNTQVVTVRHPHHDVLIVQSSLYTLEITNSDWFFNFNLIFHAPEILAVGKMMHYISDSRPNMGAVDTRYPAYPMHGLVGQTWKNARYPAKRMYQGDVDDYMLLDHQLFSSQFAFNLYQY